MADISKYFPYGIHPGATLREILIVQCLGDDFGDEDMWEFINFLDDYIQNQGTITDKEAELLAKYTEVSKDFWLTLQRNYDIAVADKKE